MYVPGDFSDTVASCDTNTPLPTSIPELPLLTLLNKEEEEEDGVMQ